MSPRPPEQSPGDERPPLEDHDEVDSPVYRRFGQPVAPVRVADVNRNTEGLVGTVFQHLLVRDGHPVPQQLQQQQQQQQHNIHNRTAQQLIHIGDQLYHTYNDRIDSLIDRLDVSSSETAYAAFEEVASMLFADGINWGRIAILFLFGYKLGVRFVVSKAPLMFVIIGWVARYVADRLSEWIAQHGGWEAIYMEYENSAKQILLVVTVVVAVYALVRWMRR